MLPVMMMTGTQILKKTVYNAFHLLSFLHLNLIRFVSHYPSHEDFKPTSKAAFYVACVEGL